jgi:hypothetical protein
MFAHGSGKVATLPRIVAVGTRSLPVRRSPAIETLGDARH